MHIVLTILSIFSLSAVVALVKERRLRLALQEILQRLLERLRRHETTPPDHGPADRGRNAYDDRLR